MFQRLEPDERLDAVTFEALLARETEALHETKRSLEIDVRLRSELIAQEYAAERRLPEMRRKLAELAADGAKIDKLLAKTAPPGAREKQRAFAALQGEMAKREEELKALAVRTKAIGDLQIELRTAAEDARRRSAAFLARVREACSGLTAEQEKSFSLSFVGNYEAVLRNAGEKVQAEAARLRGPTDPPFPPGSYMEIKARLAAAQKVLRDAGIVEKQLADLTKAQAAKAQEHKTLAQQIEHVSKARDRIREHQTERFASYQGIVNAVIAEEAILRRLYLPLESELGTLDVAERSLTLKVRRRADVDGWIRRGERLFDMRKRHAVTEPGALYRLATDHLVPAWEDDGDPVAAIKAVQAELGEVPRLQECFATDVTLEEMAAWLFSTDHIRVDYAITYDGVDIDQLSPGTRGVVLLIIYLRLDTTDDRPIVIDQPEENLDPKSVFTDLLRFFKEARKRRQIIMVIVVPSGRFLRRRRMSVLRGTSGAQANGCGHAWWLPYPSVGIGEPSHRRNSNRLLVPRLPAVGHAVLLGAPLAVKLTVLAPSVRMLLEIQANTEAAGRGWSRRRRRALTAKTNPPPRVASTYWVTSGHRDGTPAHVARTSCSRHSVPRSDAEF